MGRVQDKVALITGAGSGIGRASALLLSSEGAKVVVTDRLVEGGLETVELIEAQGGEAIFVALDVSKEEFWDAAIAKTLEQYGRLDILVNNAAVTLGRPTKDITLKEFRWQNAVNLDGVFMGVQRAINEMEKTGGGSIVNISSAAGIIGMRNAGGYSASKGGVRLLSKAAAMECAHARNNIRINSVHPGPIDTPGIAAAIDKFGGGDKTRQKFADSVPMGRLGKAEDIAYGVLYLASDESGYVTGTELIIDGGMTAE